MRLIIAAALLSGPIAITTSCAGGGAIVKPNPTADEQAKVREAGANIADGFAIGFEILRAVGRVVVVMPISAQDKLAILEPAQQVLGTTEAPGPIVALMRAMKQATESASLKATTQSALDLLEPTIKKLETHADPGLQRLGIAIRLATQVARLYVGAPGARPLTPEEQATLDAVVLELRAIPGGA